MSVKEIGPFRAGTKPVRPGVYRTAPKDPLRVGKVYQYWDGAEWHWYMPSPEGAALYTAPHTISSFQSSPWWGLAEEPQS